MPMDKVQINKIPLRGMNGDFDKIYGEGIVSKASVNMDYLNNLVPSMGEMQRVACAGEITNQSLVGIPEEWGMAKGNFGGTGEGRKITEFSDGVKLNTFSRPTLAVDGGMSEPTTLPTFTPQKSNPENPEMDLSDFNEPQTMTADDLGTDLVQQKGNPNVKYKIKETNTDGSLTVEEEGTGVTKVVSKDYVEGRTATVKTSDEVKEERGGREQKTSPVETKVEVNETTTPKAKDSVEPQDQKPEHSTYQDFIQNILQSPAVAPRAIAKILDYLKKFPQALESLENNLPSLETDEKGAVTASFWTSSGDKVAVALINTLKEHEIDIKEVVGMLI